MKCLLYTWRLKALANLRNICQVPNRTNHMNVSVFSSVTKTVQKILNTKNDHAELSKCHSKPDVAIYNMNHLHLKCMPLHFCLFFKGDFWVISHYEFNTSCQDAGRFLFESTHWDYCSGLAPVSCTNYHRQVSSRDHLKKEIYFISQNAAGARKQLQNAASK